MKNKYDLSRTIPNEVKRVVRQECGFGCIVCGNAIYTYEHIIPEWKDALSHEVDKIGLLCNNCHIQTTKGLIPKEAIQKYRDSPILYES